MLSARNEKRTEMADVARTQVDPRTAADILEAIRSIAFGEVVVTVHDRRVVQIEKKEKRRL